MLHLLLDLARSDANCLVTTTAPSPIQVANTSETKAIFAGHRALRQLFVRCSIQILCNMAQQADVPEGGTLRIVQP